MTPAATSRADERREDMRTAGIQAETLDEYVRDGIREVTRYHEDSQQVWGDLDEIARTAIELTREWLSATLADAQHRDLVVFEGHTKHTLRARWLMARDIVAGES